jgi:VWFA-related protein
MKVVLLPFAIISLLQTPVFRLGVERVQLDVSAMRGGRPVAGLIAADFVLTDNGRVQQIESAILEDTPLSVQLVLDASSSVSGTRLQHLIDACGELIDLLRDGDRAGLITFSTAVNVSVPATKDFEQVRRALANVKGGGATSLRDAVQLALETPPQENSRVLILVFTDGDDTMSWLRDADVVESARRSGVVVHVVEVRGAIRSQLLVDLTEAAGGRIYSAGSPEDLGRLFKRALAEMRARYLLTFTPRTPATPGWHELRVRTVMSGIDVKARPGYFVPPPRPD